MTRRVTAPNLFPNVLAVCQSPPILDASPLQVFGKAPEVLVMDVEQTTKPEELGEEDLVDYEEEEDAAQAAEKPSENGKDAPKKYATTTYSPPLSFIRSSALCSAMFRVVL